VTRVQAMGTNALACPGDISEPSQVQEVVAATFARFERLDILVNNAGVSGIGQTLVELSLDEWNRIIKIDLTSTFLCCRAVVPQMLAQGGGRIVNVASIFGNSGRCGQYSLLGSQKPA